MQTFLIFATLLGLSLAAPDHHTEMDHAPVYAPLAQEKIIELYEFLKAELEGEGGDFKEAHDEDLMEPVEGDEDDDQVLDEENPIVPTSSISEVRNKRSADPFFLRKLFNWKRRVFGGRRYNRGFNRRFGRRRYYH